VWLLAALVVQASAAGECRLSNIVQPVQGVTVTDSRPVLMWVATAGATRYRVEVESRVPEGRILVSLDTQVSGTRFQPPRPLTDHRAAVKVRVTAGCAPDAGGTLREQPATFYIDTSPLCPAPDRIALSADRRNVEWPAVGKAVRYDVTFLRTDGTVAGQAQAQRNSVALPARANAGTLVAVVRPYCPTGYGPRASALISAAP
jgi:hypothetical protein